MKKILVVGAGGMFGSMLSARLENRGYSIVAVCRDTSKLPGSEFCDLEDYNSIQEVVGAGSFDWIVNCAAYTAVDNAEEDYATAFSVNGTSVGNLARSAKASGAKLIHISTDYVFGGANVSREKPISEMELPTPCGIYGWSKYLGECELRSAMPDTSAILRTSWLHGPGGKNFLETILRVGKEGKPLSVVNDQFGSPTFTGYLADCCQAVIDQDQFGLYNVASYGVISWYDYACELLSQAGISVDIEPQSTESSNRKAPRPRFSALSAKKITEELGVPELFWKDSISLHLNELSN